MREDDKYGFQTREATGRRTAPAVENKVPEASAEGSAPSLEQLVNPKQPDDANHTLASEMYGWFTRNIDDRLQRYVRNPTSANKNLLDDVLRDYHDMFVDGRLWCWNAKHS